MTVEGDQKTEGSAGLTVVNPIKNEVIKEYHVFGLRPNEIDVTSDGRFIYVPARGPGVYEVFDTVKEEIVARIPVDGFAHNVVVSPDDRYMYLSAYDRGSRSVEEVAAAGQPTTLNKKIYVVDTSTHSVVATIPTGEAPRPIAISPDGQRLYVNTDNLLGFLVLDLPGRKVLHRVTYDLTPEELAIRSRSHGIGVTPVSQVLPDVFADFEYAELEHQETGGHWSPRYAVALPQLSGVVLSPGIGCSGPPGWISQARQSCRPAPGGCG